MSWEGALDLWIESHWGARLFHNPPTSCVRCLSGDGRGPDLSALSQLSCVCVSGFSISAAWLSILCALVCLRVPGADSPLPGAGRCGVGIPCAG